jgi:hypothetical protein
MRNVPLLLAALLLVGAASQAQYGGGPPPGFNNAAIQAQMRMQTQMMQQSMQQMQRMQADIMRQQQQLFHQQMMLNNMAMMNSQWQMRAYMQKVALSTYRSIMRVDSTPQASLDEPYLAKDFIERSQKVRSFSVLPAELQSYLFTKKGYFVQPMLDSLLQEKVGKEALWNITNELRTKLGANKVPIASFSSDQTCKKLEALGFSNGVVADTTLRALFDCLGTDLLVLPRVTVFGIGTRHVDDALEAGIVPDSSNKIDLESATQGVYYSIEVVAFDRRSLEEAGSGIRAMWRSQLHAKALVFKQPGAINFKARAKPYDYSVASTELSAQLAADAPLADARMKKLIRKRERELKKAAPSKSS